MLDAVFLLLLKTWAWRRIWRLPQCSCDFSKLLHFVVILAENIPELSLSYQVMPCFLGSAGEDRLVSQEVHGKFPQVKQHGVHMHLCMLCTSAVLWRAGFLLPAAFAPIWHCVWGCNQNHYMTTVSYDSFHRTPDSGNQEGTMVTYVFACRPTD